MISARNRFSRQRNFGGKTVNAGRLNQGGVTCLPNSYRTLLEQNSGCGSSLDVWATVLANDRRQPVILIRR